MGETGGSLKVGEELGMTPTAATSGVGVQFQEFVLYGSVLEPSAAALIERLKGICDPGWTPFRDHEMAFVLKLNSMEPTFLRVRRRLDQDGSEFGKTQDQLIWHLEYLGRPDPELTKKLPTTVRKRMDSKVVSRDMMNFLKHLGFRMNYEYVTQGLVFSRGNIKVTVGVISKTQTPGAAGSVERIAGSQLVEVSCVIPMGSEDPALVAKTLADFAQQLSPIVKMTKPDSLDMSRPS